MSLSILVTGASGFIGSFVVEEALRRGMEVWAGVRKSSSRRYLQDPRIHFIELDLGSADKLREQRSEEHTSELQSRQYLVCRLLLEKKKNTIHPTILYLLPPSTQLNSSP